MFVITYFYCLANPPVIDIYETLDVELNYRNLLCINHF